MLKLKTLSPILINKYTEIVYKYLKSMKIEARINKLKRDTVNLFKEKIKETNLIKKDKNYINNIIDVNISFNSLLNEQKKKIIQLINFKNNIDEVKNKLDELIQFDNFEKIELVKSNLFKDIEDIYNLFDWEVFRRNEDRKAVLKDIINELSLKACPYCGRNHIDSIEVDDYSEDEDKSKSANKIIVPCIDHFYAKGAKDSEQKEKEEKNSKKKSNANISNAEIYKNKDKYIQYSLSLYNLIPSCYLCNSQLKHDKDVADPKFQILYPYKEGFEDYVRFSLGSNSEEDILNIIERLTTKTDSNTPDYTGLSIKLVKDEEALNEHFKDKKCLDFFLKKCVNSNKMFHIEEIYNQQHIQNANDLINKIVWFRKNYIKSFLEIIGYLGNEENANESIYSKISDSYLSHLKSILDNKKLNEEDIRKILNNDFKFLFGRWFELDNDLKEPLSKFYRDIYKQITEPHLYEPLDNSS